jgi:putative transposase
VLWFVAPPSREVVGGAGSHSPSVRRDAVLPTASRRIVELLGAEGIGTLCIAKNPLWKQEANMGRRNTQSFVSVPRARFIDMLT